MSTTIFDINKFPATWGLLIFPISMSRVDAGQSPAEYIVFLREFMSKIQTPKVGVQFLYTEGLYMNFEVNAFETKNAFLQKMINHKNGVKKLLKKHHLEFQIETAFGFQSWFQMCLTSSDFLLAIQKARSLYEQDETFQKLLVDDAKRIGRDFDEKQLSFFLEEFVFSYLAMYHEFEIQNSYVEGREEWVLLAYPGKPFLSQIYFVQKNVMGFKNVGKGYIGHYDLQEKKYYDFLSIDTNSFTL
jgi:hypothetical protein